MIKERRRSPRTYSNVPLDLYDAQGRMIIGEGRFVNISLSGSLLESRQPLQVKQTIRLQAQNPGKSPFDVAGKIVWRKKIDETFNYGIQFVKVSLGQALSRPSCKPSLA